MNQAAMFALLLGMTFHSHPSAATLEPFIPAPSHHERGAPPEGLPLRPGDWKRYPRSSFGFVYQTGFGEKVDSFKGLVTKDMVSLPDTTINLRLSEAQIDTIYRSAVAIRLFDYPQPHPDGVDTGMSPHTTLRLRISAGKVTKEFSWDSDLRPANGTEDQWTRLYGFVQLIVGMVQARREWRALPPAKGGYL